MSGHSKWHNIKHRKASQDAKKSKNYTKVAKLVEIAAKKGSDPFLNPDLETALAKAKANSLPKDIIERAIKKGSGQLEGEKLEEKFYEGYGKGGVAFYIRSITTNTKRAGSNIKAILTKYGGNMGEPGSVSWQFIEKGIITIIKQFQKKIDKGREIIEELPLNIEKLENYILELEILDYAIDDDSVTIITSKENFLTVSKNLENQGYLLEDAELQFISENTVKLSLEEEANFTKLLNLLEEDDDIDTVFHNVE